MFRGKNRDNFTKPTVSLEELPKQLPKLSEMLKASGKQSLPTVPWHCRQALWQLFAAPPLCRLPALGPPGSLLQGWQEGTQTLLPLGSWILLCKPPQVAICAETAEHDGLGWLMLLSRLCRKCVVEANFSSSVSFSSLPKSCDSVYSSSFQAHNRMYVQFWEYTEPLTVGNGSWLCASVLLHLFPQFQSHWQGLWLT